MNDLRKVLVVNRAVLVDVGVVEENLVFVHAREGVANLGFACPQSLDLGSMEDNARLESLDDVVIASGFGVGQDVGHKWNQPEGRPSG